MPDILNDSTVVETPTVDSTNTPVAEETSTGEATPQVDYSWDGDFESLSSKEWWSKIDEPIRNSLSAGFETAKSKFLSEAEQKLAEAEQAKLQTEAIYALLSDMPSENVDLAKDWQSKLEAAQAEKQKAVDELNGRLTELGSKHELTSKELKELQELRANLEKKSTDVEAQLEIAVTKLAESELAYQSMVNEITYAHFAQTRPDLAQNQAAGEKFLNYLGNPDVDGDLSKAFKLLEADYPVPKKPEPVPSSVKLMNTAAPTNLESALGATESASDRYYKLMKQREREAELMDRNNW